MADDRWVAILKGDIYCAPACGGKCTVAQFEAASRAAAALCEVMGPGWAMRVWENLGWHFEVTKGCAKLHPNYRDDPLYEGRPEGFTCFLNSEAGQIVTSHPWPKTAVGLAIEEAHARADTYRKDVDAINA